VDEEHIMGLVADQQEDLAYNRMTFFQKLKVAIRYDLEIL
jgi:hypothetical protein